MTEDRDPKPADESAAVTAARQRRKRKWDQPAESLISAGLSIAGTLPLGSGSIVPLPGTVPLPGALITNPALVNSATALFQPSPISQNSVAIVQKLIQPKIQDELIAREIVINDAEPTVRYKLTKRQTQEEIQRLTGAVVITRGKYRAPNALPDSEKPLYLHISAGSHLKDTAERIKAVDHAAAMVEDILKLSQNSLPASTPSHSSSSNGQAAQPVSTCVFLGFEADPSLNIAARIRGPNEQYINHIMNETGATVVLRGRVSGNLENSAIEDAQQPLHLYLSSTNPQSLEAARSLAENLLDTISTECGASRHRASLSKVYSAVPPPQKLLSGVQSSGEALGATASPVATIQSTGLVPSPSTPGFASNGSMGVNVCPPGLSSHSGGVITHGNAQPNTVSYSYPSVTGGTCYSGYGGIYPQATPLQQVALALKKAPASTTSAIASTASTASGLASIAPVGMPYMTTSSSVTEAGKRPPQKRKFQELPVASKEAALHHQNSHQGSECFKPGSKEFDVKNVSVMPPPRKLVYTESYGMPPPPPLARTMPPPPSLARTMPPPPPKFTAEKSTSPPPKFNAPRSPPPVPKFTLAGSAPRPERSQDPVIKTSEAVPETLLKLAEYGDDDDDIDQEAEERLKSSLEQKPLSKPFWAV